MSEGSRSKDQINRRKPLPPRHIRLTLTPFTGHAQYGPVVEDDLPSGEEVYNITRTLETQHGDATAAKKIRTPQTGPEGASPSLIRPRETA